MALTIPQLASAFATGNVPGVDNVDGYRTVGEDRRYRNWHGLCAAAAYFVSAFSAGGAVISYLTAWAAWQAAPEGPNVGGKDWDGMPSDGGFFVYWDLYFNGSRDGHVGYVLPTALTGGNFVMLHGNNTLEVAWGTNLGLIGLQYFQNLKGAKFAGWSRHYGLNAPVVIVGTEEPVPAGAKRFRNPSGDVANLRSGPGRQHAIVGSIAGGSYGDFDGWSHGERVTSGNVTSDIWLRGAYSGQWAWVGSFTSQDVSGITEIPTTPVDPPKPPKPLPTYVPNDLSWVREPTVADFPAWINYTEAIDADEQGDPLVKNEADWGYYFTNYGLDEPYEPTRSIIHWWNAPGAGATFDNTVNHMLATPDKSVDYVTGPGRIAKTGSLLTASYTTGQAGMLSWSSENDPILTTDGAEAELGYRTLAYLHYAIERLNPRLRGQSIHLHKEFTATACSGLDPVRLRVTIERFFAGDIDPTTGLDRVIPEPEEPTDPGDGGDGESPEEPGDGDGNVDPKPTRPLTKEDLLVLQSLPQVTVADGALGSIIEDQKTRKTVYSIWTIIGLSIQGIGAGAIAAVAAVMAAQTQGWPPVALWAVGAFAAVAGAYTVLSPQVAVLARANPTQPTGQTITIRE